MEITQQHSREIEAIKSTLKCSKGFECERSGFENLCRAGLIGAGDLVECLSENAGRCDFALPFGDSHFCSCPLRVYIARHFYR